MDILKTNKDEWTIQVKKGMEDVTDRIGLAHASAELVKWNNRCIHKVPTHVIDENNRKLYEPQVVSFGPYKYGEKNLTEMEEHKKRALCHFLKRSKAQLDSLFEALRKHLDDLKGTYDLSLEWDTERFLMLMIQDGCFILEVLNVYSKDIVYAPGDPIFGIHGFTEKLPLIKRDMLLLANQVPFRVVRILHGIARGQGGSYRDEDPLPHDLLYLLLRFFSTSTSSLSLVWSKVSKKPRLHLLDVYREILLYEDSRIVERRTKSKNKDEYSANNVHFPSASTLYEAGIQLKCSQSTHLKDIFLDGSTLEFPAIVLTDETISTLANLVAFERVHIGAGNEVTSYVFFMNCLIQDEDDVSLLKTSKIIGNAFRNDADVVRSLSSLSKDVILGPNNMLDDVYKAVSHKLKSRVKITMNEWRLDLFRNYCKTPWVACSVCGAIVLFTLTTLQTVYTILSYKHQK